MLLSLHVLPKAMQFSLNLADSQTSAWPKHCNVLQEHCSAGFTLLAAACQCLHCYGGCRSRSLGGLGGWTTRRAQTLSWMRSPASHLAPARYSLLISLCAAPKFCIGVPWRSPSSLQDPPALQPCHNLGTVTTSPLHTANSSVETVGGSATRCCLQLVMLGSGHPPYEAAMREQEERHPHHFRGWVGFSIPVAHRIVAGMMPYTMLGL